MYANNKNSGLKSPKETSLLSRTLRLKHYHLWLEKCALNEVFIISQWYFGPRVTAVKWTCYRQDVYMNDVENVLMMLCTRKSLLRTAKQCIYTRSMHLYRVSLVCSHEKNFENVRIWCSLMLSSIQLRKPVYLVVLPFACVLGCSTLPPNSSFIRLIQSVIFGTIASFVTCLSSLTRFSLSIYTQTSQIRLSQKISPVFSTI